MYLNTCTLIQKTVRCIKKTRKQKARGREFKEQFKIQNGVCVAGETSNDFPSTVKMLNNACIIYYIIMACLHMPLFNSFLGYESQERIYFKTP